MTEEYYYRLLKQQVRHILYKSSSRRHSDCNSRMSSKDLKLWHHTLENNIKNLLKTLENVLNFLARMEFFPKISSSKICDFKRPFIFAYNLHSLSMIVSSVVGVFLSQSGWFRCFSQYLFEAGGRATSLLEFSQYPFDAGGRATSFFIDGSWCLP